MIYDFEQDLRFAVTRLVPFLQTVPELIVSNEYYINLKKLERNKEKKKDTTNDRMDERKNDRSKEITNERKR